MDAIIQELAVEHAREAALLWSLHDEDPEADLAERIRRHVVGMRACLRRGADPLAECDRPLSGADILPAACLGQVDVATDDELGQRALAAAKDFA